VSETHELLRDLQSIGATVRADGGRLFLRAGSTAIPPALVARVRRAKPKLLAELSLSAVAPAFGRMIERPHDEPGVEQQYAPRRGHVVVLDNGAFLHFCCRCGRFGAFGYGLRVRAGRLGRWYCGEHRPDREQRR
jgi:hypothetical protein